MRSGISGLALVWSMDGGVDIPKARRVLRTSVIHKSRYTATVRKSSSLLLYS